MIRSLTRESFCGFRIATLWLILLSTWLLYKKFHCVLVLTRESELRNQILSNLYSRFPPYLYRRKSPFAPYLTDRALPAGWWLTGKIRGRTISCQGKGLWLLLSTAPKSNRCRSHFDSDRTQKSMLCTLIALQMMIYSSPVNFSQRGWVNPASCYPSVGGMNFTKSLS